MSKKKRSPKKRREKLASQVRQAQIEAARERRAEKQRLSKLPKPIQQLEKELDIHVDFMMVYDGYIGDFTGEIIPAEPVVNPFIVLNRMELNLPHQDKLNKEQKKQYVDKILEATEKMGFSDNVYANENYEELYGLLFYYIENPPAGEFEDIENLKTSDISIQFIRNERPY